jgi:acyl-CoA reductase-like NAD-dependent aldehyde dehydrogenase
MKAAAEHLTPVTLELGGKSPVIVDASADLEVTASRLVWGKFFNAGQTCIAPDYVLAHRSIRAELVERMACKVREFYGDDPFTSPHLARIINGHHFNRLVDMIDPAKVVCGGLSRVHQHYIAPTILQGVTPTDAVMEEEIFGPILPVLDYDTLDEALAVIQQHPNPLALYLFTRDKKMEKQVISQVPFGGGCVNDVVSHFANGDLPFGGRGASGMGRYHGKQTFATFTHYKSLLRRGLRPDVPLRYPPYTIREQVMRVVFAIASWLS